jgi:hypothetical protein
VTIYNLIRNALQSYITYIHQVFCLEKPTQQIQPIVMMNGQNYAQAQPLSESEPEPKRESRIKGTTTPEEMEILFGDM